MSSKPPDRRQRPENRQPLNNRQLVDELCAVSPGLREARRLHVNAFGTLIPHVFMASVLAHIGGCLNADQWRQVRQHAVEITAIIGMLEKGMDVGDRETRNVISISFARDSELEPFFYMLRPQLGPKVSAQLRGNL